jgi:hypothetical protein
MEVKRVKCLIIFYLEERKALPSYTALRAVSQAVLRAIVRTNPSARRLHPSCDGFWSTTEKTRSFLPAP